MRKLKIYLDMCIYNRPFDYQGQERIAMDVMKQVNFSYFHYFKRQNKYSGHLWQGRFKNSIIENDSYLLQCGKYIELNPVRAAIVNRPEDYPYSSYKYYAYGKEDKLLTENILSEITVNPCSRR